MNERIISYSEAIEIVDQELKKKKSIRIFCEQNDLKYDTVMRIRSGKKEYPIIVQSLLKSIGYKVEIKKMVQFKIS